MKNMDITRDISQENFIKVLAKDNYPYLGSEIPDKLTQENNPLKIIWGVSIQASLAIYWNDTLDVKYESLRSIIESTKAEYELRKDNYPCGLIPTIVLPTLKFENLRNLDKAIIEADDLLGLVFSGNFVVNLDKLEGYFKNG